MLETQMCTLKECWGSNHTPQSLLFSFSFLTRSVSSQKAIHGRNLKGWAKWVGRSQILNTSYVPLVTSELTVSVYSFLLPWTHNGAKHIFKNDQIAKNNTTQLLHCTSWFPMLSVLPTRRLQTAKIITTTATLGDYIKIPLRSRKLTEAEELHQKLSSPCRKQVFSSSSSLQVFTSQP